MYRFKFIQHLLVAALVALAATSCQLKWKLPDLKDQAAMISVQRYDRLESTYLTTADFSALQQMCTDYPIETRTLLENVLQLGEINDSEINKKFLRLFQDSALQTLISDVEAEFANVDDINEGLNKAFKELKKTLPDVRIPSFYTQITALDQSIIIGDKSIGISLDKYMGQNYPLYKRFYTKEQTEQMNRAAIVPDCLCFYLVSLYPMQDFEKHSEVNRDIYISRIQWLVNKVTNGNFFKGQYVKEIEEKFNKSNITIQELLTTSDYNTPVPNK